MRNAGLLNLSFNSILVRLKARSKQTIAFRSSGFNSILVRLKAVTASAVPLMSIKNKFQFHTGSIKSETSLIETLLLV